ncbi:MAG: hypothetical protein EH225_08505, partial [Calditrichaeota bacterium]
MRPILFYFFCVTIILSCSKSPDSPSVPDSIDILEKIRALEDIEVQEITPQNGYARQFEAYITQPLDHLQPDGLQFRQRIYISHKDTDRPVVFMPSGYSSSPVKVSELSKPMQANQIYAAHRFMTGAQPSQMDWHFLTVEQASADFHNIVQIFREIYNGPWISYGASKNGQAALFHRRFYPDDVVATVALVAPLSHAAEDDRYETFLNTIGTENDRQRIQQFQRTVLKHRNEIIPLINTYLQNSDFTFTKMNSAEILEFEVLEFPFSFWQITDGNSTGIPDTGASPVELYSYLRDFGYFDFYSDELLDYYQPVYYQAFTELGWYRLIDDHLKDLLVAVPDPTYRMMAPPNVPLTFNPQIMTDLSNWLQTKGNNIIYIYGDQDPWNAGAIESVGSTNSLKIVQPAANHAVKITDLDESGLVYETLEQWLGV